MFVLTQKKDDYQSGVFATVDTDGGQVIQFFMNKDDAECYNTQLESLGTELFVSEIEDEEVSKFCDALGCAYSVAEPGQVVIPRAEMIQIELHRRLFEE